jgi:chromosome segregation ATPase
MSLIDLIEKLINEHGSFKEHLELLREQISILEKENRALKEQVSMPERENRVLKEQISILEKENRVLKEQISVPGKEHRALKSEHAIPKGREVTIESKLNKATKEIERLNEVIKVPKKDGKKPRLDAVTEKVLKLFFDTGQEQSADQVAAKLSINISTAQHHFDLLSEAKLIVQATTGDKSSWMGESTPMVFELSYSGRKYVIENKIVT